MRFEYLHILFLEAIPIVVFIIYIIKYKNRLKSISNNFSITLLEKYIEVDIKKQNFYKVLFISLSLFFLIISLARPQIGSKKIIINQPLKNIYFAIDLSSSMRARDITPSRIERAKLDVLSVIDTLQNEKVGLIFFSNNAFLQCPATTDYDIVINTIQSISEETTINTKTNIISPILLAKSLLNKDESGSSLLVVLTDGEDNYNAFNKRLKRLKGISFKLFFTIIGTPFGAPIPEKSEDGSIHYLKDSYGNLILTRINLEKTKLIVRKTGGGYIVSKNPLYDTRNIKNSYRKLNSKMIKKEFNVRRELYQIPLIISLILIILYLSVVFKNYDFFKEIRK